MRWVWVLVLPVLVMSCRGGGDAAGTGAQDVHGEMYARVDSALTGLEEEGEQAEWRVAGLRKQLSLTRDGDEVYELQKQIVEEFATVDMDSALNYAERNLALARRMHRPDRVGECRLRRSYVRTLWGDYAGANEELNAAEGYVDFDDLRIQHCFQYLYNALCGADGGSGVNADTGKRAGMLQNLLKNDADGNLMLWSRYFTTEGEDARQGLRNEVEERLTELQPDGVWMGHLGYVGALLALEAGDRCRAAELAGDVVLSLGGHVRVYAPALRMLADLAEEEGMPEMGERLRSHYERIM